MERWVGNLVGWAYGTSPRRDSAVHQIRMAQVHVMCEELAEPFVASMVGHIEEYFPSESERLGAAGTLDAIRHGVCRAREHGITTSGPARTYLNLMFTFGRDFDRDPRLPWVAEALQGSGRGGRGSGESAMGMLYIHALTHLDQAQGF